MTFPKIKSALSDIPVVHRVIDENIGAEVDRVMMGGADNDTIELQNLRKVYRNGEKLEAHDFSVGLKEGECYGFLGINGTDKTTTMGFIRSHALR
ncbi:ABCA1 lipid exporter [Phytophthora cinnamomi]|uniref:ABCA1 lipid exporter n=1 Tax=Phytophthora cinnamomi TaxID=4785 RepID=UPI0035593D4D|nr:ABCA1 lipid exporter [Phytophthora cinnamomi]